MKYIVWAFGALFFTLCGSYGEKRGLIIFSDADEYASLSSDIAEGSSDRFGALTEDFIFAISMPSVPILVSTSLVANVLFRAKVYDCFSRASSLDLCHSYWGSVDPHQEWFKTLFTSYAAIIERLQQSYRGKSARDINMQYPAIQDKNLQFYGKNISQYFLCSLIASRALSDDLWEVRRVGKHWLLLIPKAYKNHVAIQGVPEDYCLGIKVAAFPKLLLKDLKNDPYNHKGLSVLQQDPDTNFEENDKQFASLLEKDLFFITKQEYKDFNKKQPKGAASALIPQWYFLVDGHGYPEKDGVIGGFTQKTFKEFLDFCDVRYGEKVRSGINTAFIYLMSCYSSNKIMKSATDSFKNIFSKNYNFIFMAAGIAGAPTTSAGYFDFDLPPYLPYAVDATGNFILTTQQNYPRFFDTLLKTDITTLDYNKLNNMVAYGKMVENIALLRFPGIDWSMVGPSMFKVARIGKIFAATRDAKKELIVPEFFNVTKPYVLLMDAPQVSFPLRIKELPQHFVMLAAGPRYCIMDKVIIDNAAINQLKDVAECFFIPYLADLRLFFIKELVIRTTFFDKPVEFSYKNVVFTNKSHDLERDEDVYYYTDTRDGKMYKAVRNEHGTFDEAITEPYEDLWQAVAESLKQEEDISFEQLKKVIAKKLVKVI